MDVAVHLAVHPQDAEDASRLLQEHGFVCRRTNDAYVPGWQGLVATRSSVLSRVAAFAEETTRAAAVLDRARVVHRHIATGRTSKRSSDARTWYVLRAPDDALAVDLALRKKVANGKSGPGRRMAVLLLSTVFSIAHVSADTFIEARRLGAAVSPGSYMHERLAGASQRPSAPIPNRVNVAIVVLPAYLLITVVAGLARVEPWQPWAVLGGVVTVVAIVFILRTRRLTPPQRREGVGTVLFLAGVSAIAAVSLAALPAPSPERAFPSMIAFAVVAVGAGAVVEWRARGLGKAATWALPVTITVLTGAAVLLGGLSRSIYLLALRIPADAVTSEPFDRGIAGAVSLGRGALVVAGLFGVYGLMRWMFGSAAVSGVMLSLAMVLALVTAAAHAVSTGLSHADELSRARLDGADPPYFYLLQPTYVCVTGGAEDAPVEGGTLDATKPWISFGVRDSRYTLWRADSGYRRMSVDDFSTSPAHVRAPYCNRT